jgi:hypothetical protein
MAFLLILTNIFSLLFNVIILRFGRLLNKSFIFKNYVSKTAILEIDGRGMSFQL